MIDLERQQLHGGASRTSHGHRRSGRGFRAFLVDADESLVEHVRDAEAIFWVRRIGDSGEVGTPPIECRLHPELDEMLFQAQRGRGVDGKLRVMARAVEMLAGEMTIFVCCLARSLA